jgi:hypothetical protein
MSRSRLSALTNATREPAISEKRWASQRHSVESELAEGARTAPLLKM